MAPPDDLNRRLYDNSVRFTALHRGPVRRVGNTLFADSAQEDCRCALLEGGPLPGELRTQARVVRTLPWSESLAGELESVGFRRAGAMRYFVLGGELSPSAQALVPDFAVERVSTEDGLAAFSDVQAQGFLLPHESFATWQTFLHEANTRNFRDSTQHFYLGRLQGRAVAVTLLLVHAGVAGLYAVTTLPFFRRRGFSRQLLSRAVADSRALGLETVGLQVYAGTPAERMYEALGFSAAFSSTVWMRREHTLPS